jgi:hypothetical protein
LPDGRVHEALSQEPTQPRFFTFLWAKDPIQLVPEIVLGRLATRAADLVLHGGLSVKVL